MSVRPVPSARPRQAAAFAIAAILLIARAGGVSRGEDAECQSSLFHRGDSNGDGRVDVSDGLCVLESIFSGGESPGSSGGRMAPGCLEAADANNDGGVDCTDAILTLGWLFLGTAAPAAPGPPPASCGADTDAHGSPGDIGCASYTACE